jgi:hypothetical protein
MEKEIIFNFKYFLLPSYLIIAIIDLGSFFVDFNHFLGKKGNHE